MPTFTLPTAFDLVVPGSNDIDIVDLSSATGNFLLRGQAGDDILTTGDGSDRLEGAAAMTFCRRAAELT